MTIAEVGKIAPVRSWRPRRVLSGHALRRAAALVVPILAELAGQPGLAALENWCLIAAGWTITGTATFLVGPPDSSPHAVLRLSSTGGGRLQHESEVLAALSSRQGLTDFRHLVPTRCAEGVSGDWRYVLDRYIAGVDAPEAVAADPGLRLAVRQSGVDAVTELHRATAVPVVIDDALLQRWVDGPIDVLANSLHRPLRRLRRDHLDRLRDRLHQGLQGRQVHAGWIHGDFWLGNLRVDPDTGAATGVIDWDCAGTDELPAHDLLHFALYGRSVDSGVSLGTVVAETVTTGTWPAECEEILRHARWSWGDQVADADVALLYWLRYTTLMIAQQRDYAHHSVLVWQLRNVARVLRHL